MDLFKTLKNAWRVPELRKKLIFTLWMFLIIRLGAHITVPGINTEAITAMMNQNAGNVLNLMDVITGGAFKTMALFAFGVGPYITASIIMQLLQIAITKLEELAKEGEQGRKKINKITRYVTLGLAIVQATATTFTLSRQQPSVLSDNTIWTFLVVVISFVAGSMLVMWIGEQITQKGVGNGMSLIIFVNIVSRFPQSFSLLFETKGYLIPIIILILFVLIIAFVVLMAQGERRIAVQYAKRTAGRKVYGGQSQHIPIKVNLAGVLPIIFAMSIMNFPEIITNLFGGTKNDIWATILNYLRWTTTVGAVIYVVLIFAFAFFYSTIAFNPIEIASNMKKGGGFIPGIRPGKPTSEYLSDVATRITLLGAVCLAILAISPLAIQAAFNVQVAFSGTSILIVVGVALETLKQIEAQMLMRHYKGFL